MQGRSAALSTPQLQTANNLRQADIKKKKRAIKSYRRSVYIKQDETDAPIPYLVFSDTIPVEDEKLETDVVKRSGRGWQIKDKGLVKNWIECALLDMGLFLGNALSIVYQVDLDIRI